MKIFALIVSMLVITAHAHADTICSSETVNKARFLSLKKKEISIENIQVDGEYLWGNKKVKVVDFYTSGGPEQGVTILFANDQKVDIWCTDENTAGDD